MVRRFPLAVVFVALLMAAGGGRAWAATGYPASLVSSTPRVIDVSLTGEKVLEVDGSAIEPAAADLGVTSDYFNTHRAQFYELRLAVVSPSGNVGPTMVCTQGGSDCATASGGSSLVQVDFNPTKLVGLNGGQYILAVVRHYWPRAGGGTYAVDSNALRIPIVGALTGPPTAVHLTPASFAPDTTAWTITVSASNVDGGSSATLDGIGALSVNATMTGVSTGTFLLPVPADHRTAGPHTVTVCRWVQNPSSSGENGICAAPVSIAVQTRFERAANPTAGVVAAPLTSALAPAVARSLTVTCARAPLFADLSGTPLRAGGSAVVLPQNSVVFTDGSAVQGSAASYYRLDLGATAYISTACAH